MAFGWAARSEDVKERGQAKRTRETQKEPLPKPALERETRRPESLVRHLRVKEMVRHLVRVAL